MELHPGPWRWVAAVTLAAGVAAFAAAARKGRDEDADSPMLHLFVCAAGVLAYFAMARSHGEVHLARHPADVFSWLHYLYWALTEPLILGSVVTVTLPPVQELDETRGRLALVGSLVGANLLWNVTSLGQGLLSTSGERWCWYAASCAALAGLFYGLGCVVRAEVRRRSPSAVASYDVLAGGLALLWVGYQISFTAGATGLRWWGQNVDTALYAVLDVAGDLGLGLLTLLLLHRLTQRHRPDAGGSTAGALPRLPRSHAVS
jgi:bacteriorhodopsin